MTDDPRLAEESELGGARSKNFPVCWSTLPPEVGFPQPGVRVGSSVTYFRPSSCWLEGFLLGNPLYAACRLLFEGQPSSGVLRSAMLFA